MSSLRKKVTVVPAPDNVAIPARAALEHALSSGARVVLIAWETDETLCHATVPASRVLAEGIIMNLGKQMFSDGIEK